MKKGTLLKVCLILVVFVSQSYALGITDTINKFFDFLDDGLVKAVAGILFVGIGLTLGLGYAEKAKIGLLCVLFGIGLVYGAKEIADIIF